MTKEETIEWTFRQELDFQFGEIYNDYKILNKYPSANEMVDAMVEKCITEIEKRIDSKIENSTDPFEIVAYKNMKEVLK